MSHATQFSKIKWNGSQVQLTWTETTIAGTEHEHTVRSSEQPHPDFDEAFKAFLSFVLSTLELPDTYGTELRVTGLSINTEADGRRSLVVTSLKKLERANAPLVLNTPHLRENGGEDVGNFLPDRILSLVETAEDVARGYLEGRRAQIDMFDGERA